VYLARAVHSRCLPGNREREREGRLVFGRSDFAVGRLQVKIRWEARSFRKTSRRWIEFKQEMAVKVQIGCVC
jgi:hypothetical protein